MSEDSIKIDIAVSVLFVSIKLSFRTLYDFDLNKAIGIYDFIT